MTKPIDVRAYLPHREPFLLIDGVTRIDENEIECLRNIRPEEYYFAGHFPGNPVLPGVLMVEAIAQAGILLVLIHQPELVGKTPLFAGIDDVRFRRVVRPGEQLRIIAKLITARAGVFKFAGRVLVGDELACTATVTGAVR
jgi:beta-hydroxyacyl-ACP dehydratase FabZ|uniref:3-hydroxyacyl-[acyl-carrier-protein] dehydratase n=1 Tax=candidate division WOR-3 bacterium TaxID=2052148 RepID=A0A7V3UZQ6_UNCW3